MNKVQLIEFLKSHFNTIIINDKFKSPIKNDEIRMILDIKPESIDDKCLVNVADIIVKNNKNQIFYFLYYSKKDTVMIYDDQKKCINIKMPNNVMKMYQYENVLKRVKKYINKSNSYLVFFSCGDVEFNQPISKRIIIVNELTIDGYLGNKYDM